MLTQAQQALLALVRPRKGETFAELAGRARRSTAGSARTKYFVLQLAGLNWTR